MRPLSDLPNRDGFRFIGVRRDGTEGEYVVAQNSLTRVYHVVGFADLVGWRHLP